MSNKTTNSYESGRLNLPFVGICTFGKYPYVSDWDAIDADVAVMGAPYDFGCQWRSGARMGPRAVREASTLFSFGHAGAYDHEDDVTYLEADKTRIVDIGDADVVHTDTLQSHANIEFGVRKALSAIKGGRLAAAAAPARCVSWLISDVISNRSAGDGRREGFQAPIACDTPAAPEAVEIEDRHRARLLRARDGGLAEVPALARRPVEGRDRAHGR